MHFTKMHGTGNDFIIINNMRENIPEDKLSQLARLLCRPHLSIGADALMVVTQARSGGDYGMLFYNPDGSLGEMCGNGARCIARYGYENGLAGETQRIEATAGIVTGKRITKRLYQIRLNDPSILDLHRTVTVSSGEYDCAYVELGDPGIPHAVVPMDNWDQADINTLRELGRELRYAPAFPKGANVTFVKRLSDSSLKAITFERGVEDFTLACGTGCGSTVAAFTLLGLVTGKNVCVSKPGGDLYISLSVSSGTVSDIMLTGPTNIVCEGEITDEDVCI